MASGKLVSFRALTLLTVTPAYTSSFALVSIELSFPLFSHPY